MNNYYQENSEYTYTQLDIPSTSNSSNIYNITPTTNPMPYEKPIFFKNTYPKYVDQDNALKNLLVQWNLEMVYATCIGMLQY